MPRTIFFTLRFAEPRGVVRLALGAAFFLAARFAFLRSSLLSDVVFAIDFQSYEFRDHMRKDGAWPISVANLFFGRQETHKNAANDHYQSEPDQKAARVERLDGMGRPADNVTDDGDADAAPSQDVSEYLFVHAFSSCANFSTSFFSPNWGNCTVIFASSPSPSRL